MIKNEFNREEEGFMEQYDYALLDKNNICIAVIQAAGELDCENIVKLNENDTAILGRKYEGGLFVELESNETDGISEQDMIQSEILLSQSELKLELMGIKETSNNIEETLALLLLENAKGDIYV